MFKLKTGFMVAGLGLAILAGPVLAQQGVTIELPQGNSSDDICDAVSAEATWINGDAASSDVMAADGPFDRGALPILPGGTAVFGFTMGVGGEVRLEASPGLGGDSVIELFHADGQYILSDDDGGGSLASRAETILAPGTYCLLTRAFGDGPLVTDLRIARMEFDPITTPSGFDWESDIVDQGQPCAPDTPAVSLGALPDGGVLTRTNSVMDAPFYRFTLPTAQPVTIRAENEWADPVIALYDASGTFLAENDDHDGLNAQIDMTDALPAGDYCVAVSALSSDVDPVDVTVVAFDPQRDRDRQYAAGETPPGPDTGYPVTELGRLKSVVSLQQQVGSDAVWIGFEMPEEGLLVVSAEEVSNSDPVIALFDASGQEIAYNDDANGSFNSQIISQLAPGEYMLAVMQFSSTGEGVIDVTLERYVRAQ